MPEDMKSNRKSGLNYTKRFVGTNGGDEAVGYQQQMGMVCNGDGEQACFLEGLYGKLVTMAAALSRAKRGYLLDADDQPLSSAQIAKLLNIKSPTMRKMIARFEAVRLLEKVEMPEFDLSKNEPPPPADEGGKGKKAGRRQVSGNLRKFPEKSGKKEKPLKEPKPKPKQESLTGLNGKLQKSATLTGCLKEEQSTIEQGKPHRNIAQHISRDPEKPENPKESEAGEAAKHIMPTPPRSVHRDDPQPIGRIIADRLPEHWQDADAEAFGWEIVEALGLPEDRHNMEIRSQWGEFAKWWCKVKHAAPAMMLPELRSTAIRKAVWIYAGPKKPKNVRNPPALWNNIMAKELLHHGIRLPPARASPLKHARI